MLYNTTKNLEDFYNSLNEAQKTKVEAKLKTLLKESMETLPFDKVNQMRYQVASDMFQILKG